MLALYAGVPEGPVRAYLFSLTSDTAPLTPASLIDAPLMGTLLSESLPLGLPILSGP